MLKKIMTGCWLDETKVRIQMRCSDLKVGHQDGNPSIGHQGDITHSVGVGQNN